jgi:hypothetical protein
MSEAAGPLAGRFLYWLLLAGEARPLATAWSIMPWIFWSILAIDVLLAAQRVHVRIQGLQRRSGRFQLVSHDYRL